MTWFCSWCGGGVQKMMKIFYCFCGIIPYDLRYNIFPEFSGGLSWKS
jgi:hypothetical protein